MSRGVLERSSISGVLSTERCPTKEKNGTVINLRVDYKKDRDGKKKKKGIEIDKEGSPGEGKERVVCSREYRAGNRSG